MIWARSFSSLIAAISSFESELSLLVSYLATPALAEVTAAAAASPAASSCFGAWPADLISSVLMAPSRSLSRAVIWARSFSSLIAAISSFESELSLLVSYLATPALAEVTAAASAAEATPAKRARAMMRMLRIMGLPFLPEQVLSRSG